ncbi:hypothetical protein TNCV_3946731 [Trichonephila clavipes]|nr:hypothetical protein TNCV_3946731 [Trichonephila clavipes]
MATDLVILNHGQVTRTTPELVPPPFYTTGGRLSLDRFTVQRPSLNGGSSMTIVIFLPSTLAGYRPRLSQTDTQPAAHRAFLSDPVMAHYS